MKLKSLVTVGAIVITLGILVGCGSTGDPVQVSQTGGGRNAPAFTASAPFTGEQSSGNHSLWGYYHLSFDLEKMTAEAVPDRDAGNHINITNFVQSQNCVGCLAIDIEEHNPVTRTLRIKVTLSNTTNWTGYDIKGILLPEVDGVRLRNADGFTGLWNSGAFVTRNPYRAFAQGVAQRAFPPDYYDYRTYQISYFQPEALKEIGYAIDVSFPGNCLEPYQIDVPLDPPEFIEHNMTSVVVHVRDWQDNVESVYIYPFPLTMSGYWDSLEMSNTSGDVWSVMFANTNQAHPASYYLWVQAISSDSGISCWNQVKVTIPPEEPPPPPDTSDVQVRYYVATDHSDRLPYYRNPSGGTVDFTYDIAKAQRMWANKFWNNYGMNLVDNGTFMIMDDEEDDHGFYILDEGEILPMHAKYGQKYSPDALCMYFVQMLPSGMDTAFCVWPSFVDTLSEHNSQNVFHVYSPNVWYWQESMAHESGHAFGALIDEYLLIPSMGVNCYILKLLLGPGYQHLYCDDTGYYEGNLMWFSMGWSINQYDLTRGQADYVTKFNEDYANNWL
jgi:hypothetical protein